MSELMLRKTDEENLARVCTANLLVPPGIRNIGQICYASSVLQCLFNQEVFSNALQRLSTVHHNCCCKPGTGSTR